MKNISNKGKRLAALFFLGWVLWNFPIISLFDRNLLIMGFPLLFVYIFSIWAVFIVLIALIVRKRSTSRSRDFSGFSG